MIKNVSAGLPEEAIQLLNDYSEKFLDKKIFDRTGPIKALELYEYKLKNNVVAQEFCQEVIEINNKFIYFIGLKVNKKTIVWKSKELKEFIKERF